MRQLLFAFAFLIGFSMISCSDNGSGTTGDDTQMYDVSVSMSPSDGGSVSPSDTTVEEGTELSLEAEPTEEYLFTHWTGDVDSTADNPFLLMVDQDYSLNANFEIKSYELAVNTDGKGSVSEEMVLQKSKEYEHGTVVELTANPAEGYKFVEWQGDVTGTDNPTQITIDDPKEVTAVFEKKSYELTINTDGEGAVSEEVVQQKSTDYEHGTVVELTANPAEGWQFVEWTGAKNGIDNPVQITVDEPKEVTAVFEKKSYSLTTSVNGEGSIAKDPDQQEYKYNTTVELTANPAEGWKFVEWQGDLSSTDNPSQITIDSNKKEVTAVFEKQTFTLSVETTGEGSVSLNPDQTEYEYGTEVELTATASGDWVFDKWEGDLTGETNPVTVTIDTDKTITAVFENILFAGGAGTQENPFQISTVDQLQSINEYPDANYVQINDIDASETKSWNGGKGFKPIGDSIIRFTGSFNGQNFKISNLTISRSDQDNVGLFGIVDQGKITDVNLININIHAKGGIGGLVGGNINSTVSNSSITGIVSGSESTGNGIGGLIGSNQESEVNNSTASVDISGKGALGGLIGRNSTNSIVKNSHANGDISGVTTLGGLVGNNNHGSIIKNSYAAGNITGTNGLGGLSGYNDTSSEITNSYATGNIEASDKVAGGLVGNNAGIIKYSYAEGSISGIEEIGGLIGRNTTNSSTIKGSYAHGNVNGDISVGGLVGTNQNDASILESYSTGNVTGETDIGGLVGTNGATIDSSYWDTESTNQTSGVGRGSSDGTTGLTTSKMTGSSTKENMSDFDWEEIWVTTDSYPVLFWE